MLGRSFGFPYVVGLFYFTPGRTCAGFTPLPKAVLHHPCKLFPDLQLTFRARCDTAARARTFFGALLLLVGKSAAATFGLFRK